MSSSEYYAKDSSGNEIYKVNNLGSQYYASVNNVNKIFAKKANGNQYYAKSKTGNEFYPYISGHPVYIMKSDGTQVYAKKKDQSDSYPRDKDGKEIILTNDKRQFYYAKDKNGDEIYPKFANGKEYMPVPGKYAVKHSGQAMYNVDESGKPIYPKDNNGNEIYELTDLVTKKPIFGEGVNGQYYAKDQFLNEYYPIINSPQGQYDWVAKDNLGNDIYAFTNDGKIVYPKDIDGHEYYLMTNKFDYYEYLINSGKTFDYAKQSDNQELYPLHKLSSTMWMEMYVNNRYAKTSNGKDYYPRDEFGNEYILDFNLNLTESEIFVNSYPITVDSFYIVPNINGQAYILSNVPNIEINNITSQLFRKATNFKDFVTNVKSNRKLNLNTHFLPYKTKPVNLFQIKKFNTINTSTPTFNNWHYILGILGIFLLCIIIKLFS